MVETETFTAVTPGLRLINVIMHLSGTLCPAPNVETEAKGGQGPGLRL